MQVGVMIKGVYEKMGPTDGDGDAFSSIVSVILTKAT